MTRSQNRTALRRHYRQRVVVEKTGDGWWCVRLLVGGGYLIDGNGWNLKTAQTRRRDLVEALVDDLCPPAVRIRPVDRGEGEP